MQPADIVEVVATAQICDATRVIVLTAHQPHPGHFVVETDAYDSGHPGEVLGQCTWGGPVLAALVATAREHGARTFEHCTPIVGCDCWARWDPYCGTPGCWGVYDPKQDRTADAPTSHGTGCPPSCCGAGVSQWR